MTEIALALKTINELKTLIKKEEKEFKKPLPLVSSELKQSYRKAVKSIENRLSNHLPKDYSSSSLTTKSNGYILPNPTIKVFMRKSFKSLIQPPYILILLHENSIELQLNFEFRKISQEIGCPDYVYQKFVEDSKSDFIELNDIKEEDGFNFDRSGPSLLIKKLKIRRFSKINNDILTLITTQKSIKISINHIINEKFDLQIDDLISPKSDSTPTGKDILLLKKSRIGHGKYREILFEKWSGKCCITGCDLEPILVASHIKPWAKCTPEEKVDPDNGLLLCPNYDALFDRYLISFDESGKIIISSLIKEECITKIGINREFYLKLNQKQLMYMQFHRRELHKSDEADVHISINAPTLNF